MMSKGSKSQAHVERQPGNRVSSAVWPVSVRKVVATGKAAQRRRDWIIQGRWWMILADGLVMRVLFILNMVLVVVISLLVAVLGLTFWYLLLLPLVFLVALLLVPSFVSSRTPAETAHSALSTLAQEFKNSSGTLLPSTQDLRSQPGVLLFKGQTDMLADNAPLTPMPADQPLVRVLETYDLRATPVEHFLTSLPDEETGEHALVHAVENNPWTYTNMVSLETGALAHRSLEDQIWGHGELSMQNFPKSEQGEPGDS